MLKLLYFCSLLLLISQEVRAQVTANVCNSNECRFGSCEITSSTSYKCHCVAGVTGTNCDTQAAVGVPCASNPCYNNGVCTNVGTTGFTCACPAGLGGPLCKGTINVCNCQNGGVCAPTVTNGVTVNQCNCASGFGGNLCEYRISAFVSCFSAGCQNGGTCTILSTCMCPTGFAGNLCELTSTGTTTLPTSVTNPTLALCFTGICQNGGICTQIAYNIGTCSCINGFSGIYCNLPPLNPTTATTTTTTTTTTLAPVTTTAPSQACPASLATFCQNQGTCLFFPTTNTISCRCAPSFSGPTCATKMAFCSVAGICKNGGTCVTTNSPAVGDGTCTCPTGFQGQTCDIAACNSATTCNAHGICINNACLCFAGFTGPTCV